MPLNAYHKRLVTAGVLIAVTIAAIWLGGWFLFVLALLLAGQGLYEFYMMFWADRGKYISVSAGMLLGALLLLLSLHQQWLWALILLLGVFWIVNLKFLFHYSRPAVTDATPEGSPVDAPASKAAAETSYQDNLILLAGILYIPGMLQFLLFIPAREIIIILIAAAATDIGGYYAGRQFGGRKIWPRISPKKTVAGSFGGLGLCLAACLIYGLIFGTGPWWGFVILGIILNLAAQFGDFFESALKRRQGIKDSGTILPGHGGVLDRIDSLLMVIPTYMIFTRLVPLF